MTAHASGNLQRNAYANAPLQDHEQVQHRARCTGANHSCRSFELAWHIRSLKHVT